MFIHDAVLEEILCGSTAIQPQDLRIRIKRLGKQEDGKQETMAAQLLSVSTTRPMHALYGVQH